MCEVSHTVRFKEAKIAKPSSLVSCFEANGVNDKEYIKKENILHKRAVLLVQRSQFNLFTSRSNKKIMISQADPSKTSVRAMWGSVRNSSKAKG